MSEPEPHRHRQVAESFGTDAERYDRTRPARVLRPGGRLAPFHHVFQPPPEVMEALATVYRQVAPDSPVTITSQLTRSPLDAYQPLFAKIADGIRAVSG